MTNRSRRQTRRLRCDVPPHRWPQNHNESVARAKRIKRLNGRFRDLGRAFVRIAAAMGPLTQAMLRLSEQVEAMDAALDAVRHLEIRREDVLREYETSPYTLEETTQRIIRRETEFQDLMAFRGFDMREDNTFV